MSESSATQSEAAVHEVGVHHDRAIKRVSFSWVEAGQGIKTVSMPLCRHHYEAYLQWKPFLTKCHRELDVDERYCATCLSANNARGSHS